MGWLEKLIIGLAIALALVTGVAVLSPNQCYGQWFCSGPCYSGSMCGSGCSCINERCVSVR